MTGPRALRVSGLPGEAVFPRIPWRDFRLLLWLAPMMFAPVLLIALLLGAVSADERLRWALFLASVLSLYWQASTYLRIPSMGKTRFSSRAGNLRFLPHRDIFWVPYVFLFFLVYAATYESTITRFARVQALGWAVLAVGVGIYGLIWTLRRAFFPTGLTLTTEYLCGVRGDIALRIPWDDLIEVSVGETRGPYLYLTRFGHPPIRIDSRFTGTDVNVLYWSVRYFLDHPEERDVLRDPEAALRRVEAAYQVVPGS